MQIAANVKDDEIFLYLIEDAKFQYEDELGQTVLHFAAKENLQDSFDHILKTDPNSIFKTDKNGRNALHIAAQFGNSQIVLTILKVNETLVQSKDAQGFLPFHYAAWQGHLELMEYLLQINPGSGVEKTTDGFTGFQMAAFNGHLSVVKKLLEMNVVGENDIEEKEKALLMSSRNGFLGVLKLMVEQNHISIHASDEEGNKALHLASLYGHTETVSYLLKSYFADPNSKNVYGYSPFQLAVSNYQLGPVRLLIPVSDIFKRDIDNNTLLHLATLNGRVFPKQLKAEQAISKLKAKEIDLVVEQFNDTRFINLAQSASNRRMLFLIRLLETETKDLLATNNDGNTPLHTAVIGGNISIVKYLVETFNVDGFVKNNDDQTPAILAAAVGNFDIKKYLDHNIL